MGSLTGKSGELARWLKYGKNEIGFLLEIRWKGNGTQHIGERYKLVVNSEGVVEVRRVNSLFMPVRVVWWCLVSNLVSAYGPQDGWDEATKREFSEEFDSPPQYQ